jgi:hypothetical protein
MKAFLAFYVALMFFALVFGGEHYIFDAILGAIYALAVEYGCRAWERGSARRRANIGVDDSFKGL